jgi:hypothetical protein
MVGLPSAGPFPWSLSSAMALLRTSLVAVAAGLLVLGGSLGPCDVRAQPDSVRAEILKEKGFPPSHSPQGALWRTAAVPGWGQYYNRQYYKIPLVYAGLVGLAVRIYRSHQEYLLFDRAHLFGIGREREGANENPYEQYESQFNEVKEEVFLGGTVRLGEVRNQRDQFRRRRDLTILGAGLFYALTLLDAYVSAHLLTFDVDEELAVRVRPTAPAGSVIAMQAAPGAASQRFTGTLSDGVGVHVQVRF